MPATLSGFGLKAKHSPSGVIRPQRYVIPASEIIANSGSWPTNLYQDDAVYIDTNGRIQLTGSAAGAQCLGSFSGVEFNDSNGRRTVSNQFVRGGIANPVANQGLGTTDVWFWLYTDPELIFEIQLAGNSTGGAGPLTFAAVGSGYAYVQNAAATNAVTGFAAGYGTPVTGGATVATGAPFIVYNLAYDYQPNNNYAIGTPPANPGNANSWGDAYPNVLVKLSNAQFNGTVPSF